MTYDASAAVRVLPSADDLSLARRIAPTIRFAANEPFLPSKIGITVLDRAEKSPSAPLEVTFEPGVARVIEYAIWWDWDIGHLYELEHIWLKLDADDNIVRVDASAHGKLFAMTLEDGSLPTENGRVTLYSEPGKHAFHATAAAIIDKRRAMTAACSELAGNGLVLINAMFAEAFAGVTREDHRAVKRYLQDRAFQPSFDFSQRFDLSDIDYMSWPDLHAYIAGRVPAILAQVRREQPLLKAVFLDSGDTLVDEATEIRDADGYVIEASLIPGAKEMVEVLAAEGYRLALVADGRVRSFETILGMHGVRPHIEVEAISEALDCEKPAALMFETALRGLGLTDADAASVVMIGNHLERDIKGANRKGIISIWQNWSPRRSKIPADIEEVPDFVVRSPSEVPQLLALIERQMAKASATTALKPLQAAS